MPFTLAKLINDVKIAAMLASYGKNYLLLFIAARLKFKIDLDNVVQLALLVHLEKFDDCDDPKELDDFLWGHLNARLKRATFGALRYAVSINEDSEFGMQIQKDIESIATENNDRPDWKFDEISQVPGLVELHTDAESISGKSTREIAIERKLSVRRINQILQEKIARAKILRDQITKTVAPKIINKKQAKQTVTPKKKPKKK